MLEQAKRARAGALLETRLQRPDFFDRRFEAAWNGDPLGLPRQHAVHHFEQRRQRLLAACLRLRPIGQDLMPQERREQKSRRDAFAFTDPRVGVGERNLDELLPERLLQDHVQERQQAMRKPVRAQAFQRFD